MRTSIRSQFKSAFNTTCIVGICRDFTKWLARHYDLKMVVGGGFDGVRREKRVGIQTFDAVLYRGQHVCLSFIRIGTKYRANSAAKDLIKKESAIVSGREFRT